MKKILQLAAAAVLTLFASSCIEHTSTIRLNKDGSGTITEETLLSAEVTAMIAQMGEGAEDPAEKMADPKKAAAAAKKMGEGVSVEKVQKIDKDGRKGARVIFKFKDINEVQYRFGETMSDKEDDAGEPGAAGDAPDDEAAAPQNQPIAFRYKNGKLSLANPVNQNAADKKPADKDAKKDADTIDLSDELDEEAIANMKKAFKDMRMALLIELPGGIAETDASHVEGSTVTLMDVAFGKLLSDPKNLKKLSAMQGASPTKMAAAFKGIEGIKIETRDTITVELK